MAAPFKAEPSLEPLGQLRVLSGRLRANVCEVWDGGQIPRFRVVGVGKGGARGRLVGSGSDLKVFWAGF